MDKQEMIERKKDLMRQISTLREEKNEIELAIALFNCPFAVGDAVVSKEGVKAIVSSIIRGWNDDDYRMSVRKIKKNGEPYKDSTRAYDSDEWKKTNKDT